MKAPNLLSTNDYKRILKALREHREDTLTMTLGDYKITVSVVLLRDAAQLWGQTHNICVEEWDKNIYSRKNCATVEELRWFLSSCRQRK